MLKINFRIEDFENLYKIQNLNEIGHIFLVTISGGNLYLLNFIYSILFVFPLFYFCFNLQRKYLSLVISYPYYILIVGMGPIRQAACTSILMLSIILISKRKYYSHFFLSFFSFLIHQFSLIFNVLLFASYFPKFIKNISIRFILFLALISLAIVIQSPSLIRKSITYITLIGEIFEPAKSAMIIWFINFIPSLIYILNKDRFNLNNALKRIFFIFSISEFLLLPVVFFNSLIAYRLLIYIFPTSIYITSRIPDLKLFKLKSQYLTISIIITSFISLIIWIRFAYHSSCWLPYKNIIMN